MGIDRRLKMTLSRKKSIMAYLLLLPWMLGFAFFFLYPFIQSIVFSFSELVITAEGFELANVGWKNYRYTLMVHPSFVRVFTETFRRMLVDVPLVFVFSFLMAVLLNQQFRGRTLARIIFFLPVVMGAGVILQIEQSDFMMQILGSMTGRASFFSVAQLQSFLMQIKLPLWLLEYVMDAVNHIPVIIRASGIQILILLAGLQSIPSSLYEAAHVEGGTDWENFWMITFPMMSSVMLTVIVYTIIDSFTSQSNALVALIRGTAFSGSIGYGVSIAMATMYFAAIALVLIIINWIFSGGVFYHE